VSVAILEELRTDPIRRSGVLVGGSVVGLALAQVHWLGFLVGGALVGLAAPTLRRAVLAGLAFGVLALVVFGVELATAGALGAALGMGQITYLTVAIPLVCGLAGSLVRALV